MTVRNLMNTCVGASVHGGNSVCTGADCDSIVGNASRGATAAGAAAATDNLANTTLTELNVGDGVSSAFCGDATRQR